MRLLHVLGLPLIAIPLLAQTPTPSSPSSQQSPAVGYATPLFNATTRNVILDAVVTDKKGSVVTGLTRTMEKIYHPRGVAIDVQAPTGVRFRGERQDLEEMLGNLVDNACKWAQARVSVEVTPERDGGTPAKSVIRIAVDDDGPGLSPAEREQVAQRGQRLDESKPGSGLGLSIVLELAALYGGGLTLSNAPIGGLRAELVLPAA